MSIRLGLRDWGGGELLAAAGAALGLGARGAAARRVAEWFTQAYGRQAHALNAGSTALRLALHCLAAQRPGRDEVVVPALACPAVTQATLACGLRPVYADIGAGLNTPVEQVDRCLGARTLAVVVVHAYGHPADTPGLAALCQSRGVALIDDAAQRVDPALGLGRGGDFGVISFAQSKDVVTGIDGSGGILLVNDPRHAEWIARQVASLPVATGRTSAWLEFLTEPGAPRLTYHIGRWRRRHGSVFPGDARLADLDAAIAERQLGNLASRRARRLGQLEAYRSALQAEGLVAPQLPHQGPVDFLARLMVRFDPHQRSACREALVSAGIFTRLPYRLAPGIDPAQHPHAVREANSLLELPLPPHLSAADIRRIVQLAAPFAGRRHTQTGNLACSTIGN